MDCYEETDQEREYVSSAMDALAAKGYLACFEYEREGEKVAAYCIADYCSMCMRKESIASQRLLGAFLWKLQGSVGHGDGAGDCDLGNPDQSAAAEIYLRCKANLVGKGVFQGEKLHYLEEWLLSGGSF